MTNDLSNPLDKLTQAARLNQQAGWLKIMVDHRIDLHDPAIAEELKTATDLGVQAVLLAEGRSYSDAQLPEALRSVDPRYVYFHINQLSAQAETLRRQAG